MQIYESNIEKVVFVEPEKVDYYVVEGKDFMLDGMLDLSYSVNVD